MSGAEKFKGKELLGTFDGRAALGERIVIQSQPGWEKRSGRYLIVQISNPGGTILHLREVSATGSAIKFQGSYHNFLHMAHFIGNQMIFLRMDRHRERVF